MTTSLPELHEPLGALHRQLGDGRVILGMLVERRGDDFAVDRPLHVGDFFGPLVDEQRDDVGVGMVDRDRVGDVLEQRRLTGFGRRDDQRALALADRREEIDDARRELRRANFEFEALLRIDRRALFERAAALDRLGVEIVDFVDADQPVVLFALFRPADLALDHVAAAQLEAANLRLADVDVVVADDSSRRGAKSRSLRATCRGCRWPSRCRSARSAPDTISVTISSFLSLAGRRESRLRVRWRSSSSSVFVFSASCAAVSIGGTVDLRKLVVKRPDVLRKVPMARRGDGDLRLDGGRMSLDAAMFGLQRSISLVRVAHVKPRRPSAGEAAFAIGSVTRTWGCQTVSRLSQTTRSATPTL